MDSSYCWPNSYNGDGFTQGKATNYVNTTNNHEGTLNDSFNFNEYA